MTQTKACVVVPTTQNYIVMPQTGKIILPPRSDVRPEDLPPPDDIFFYGWREVEYWVDGVEVGARMPLTLEDVIHPQLGDYIVQNKKHASLCDDLWDGLKGHIGYEPGTVILHDVGIDWGVPDLDVHSPDLAVLRGVELVFEEGIFYLKDSKGHVVLVLEVTSPSTRAADVEGKREPNKVQEYAQAGVPTYILIDAVKATAGRPPPIIVFVMDEDGNYYKLTPDARGWYWIEVLQVWIGPHGEWVAWYDKDDRKLGTYVEECEARKLAEDKARLTEEKRREEAEARKLAEDEVRQANERIRELEALLAAKDAS